MPLLSSVSLPPAVCAAATAGLLWYLTWLGVGIDCRRTGGSSLECWGRNPLTVQVSEIERLVTALGGLGIGGWLGYNTYNPSLRDPRTPPER